MNKTKEQLQNELKALKLKELEIENQLQQISNESDSIVMNNEVYQIEPFMRMFSKEFPVSECTIKSAKESAIYDGEHPYLCLIADKSNKYEMVLRILKPYIWIGDEVEGYEEDLEEFKGQIGYGWSNGCNTHYDNFEKPIKEFDEFIMGWIRL